MFRRILESSTVRNFLRGATTVLDICPNTRYWTYLDKLSDTERIAKDWQAIAKDFSNAEVENWQKISELTSKEKTHRHYLVSSPTEGQKKERRR